MLDPQTKMAPFKKEKDDVLTKDQFMKALPKAYRGKVNDDMIEDINKTLSSQELRENFRDNLVGYSSLLNDGRFKLTGYIDAVKYVSHKLLGSTNLEAYAKTFPDRVQRLVSEGADNDTISRYSTAFNKTKLVNLIFEQTLIPTHILNADVYQKAINKQAYLMAHAKSEKVQTDAANSLLNHLKRPEIHKVELDVGFKEDKTITELREVTAELARQQRAMITGGTMNASDIAASRIINDAEYEEV